MWEHINEIDISNLADLAQKKQVEISVTVEPDGRMEMSVSPWRAFSYSCPYRSEHEDDLK